MWNLNISPAWKSFPPIPALKEKISTPLGTKEMRDRPMGYRDTKGCKGTVTLQVF